MNKIFSIIAIEGLDGCFKQTITKQLQQLMVSQLGIHNIIIRKHSFPSYNDNIGSAFLAERYLKGDVFGPAIDVDPVIASSFFINDFNITVRNIENNISKSLVDNFDMLYYIFDRYTLSNRIYQKAKLDIKEWSYSKEVVEELITKMEYTACLPEPKCKIFLYMPYEVSRRILEKREATTGVILDGHESSEKYMYAVHQNAREEALRNGYKVIDIDEQCLPSTTYSKDILLPQVVEEVNRVCKSKFNGVTLSV